MAELTLWERDYTTFPKSVFVHISREKFAFLIQVELIESLVALALSWNLSFALV